jgi:hypothetical protein
MKPRTPLADKIRNLKKGESFTVKTEIERAAALRMAKALNDAGYLPAKITTRANGSGFTVAAI